MKLDKKAHARALKLHQKMMLEDPAYREAWDKMVIELFTDLADAPAITSPNREAGK